MKSRQSWNPFCQPVLQTAGGRAVFDCRLIKRWNGQYDDSSKEKADQSFKVFEKNVGTSGADISVSVMAGLLLQTILIETKGSIAILLLKTKETSDNVLITDELRHDLNRIYDLLIRYCVTAGRNSCLSGRFLLKESFTKTVRPWSF